MSATIPFPHRLGGHCASSAFRDLFEHRGYRHDGAPLSEAMVFGLGAGLDVFYLRAPVPRVPFYLGGRTPGLEESLMARVGGGLVRRSEPDDDAAWAWVREKLDRGEPVPLVADCQKLEYLKTRASMPLHVVVAVGYDATHALIADNDRAEVQRCSLVSLRTARAAEGFPLPAMNVTFEVAWPETLPPLATLVRPAIAETVRWMREPTGPGVWLFGIDAFGLRAMDVLERDVASWASAPPAAPALCAMMLWIAVEKGGTGGAFFRRLYRDFLREAHALSPSPALAQAAAHYGALADDWTLLGSRAASGKWGEVPDRVRALLAGEREGVQLLARVAGE